MLSLPGGYVFTWVCTDIRLYSKSSLTLSEIEWRFNLSFPWVSMLFLNRWRVSSHIVRYGTNPPAIQKVWVSSREAQIEPPLIEFSEKRYQFPVRNTKWLKNGKLRRAILSAFYNISQRNFGILLILWCSFRLSSCDDIFVSTCLD
jgi:hypothetical protein